MLQNLVLSMKVYLKNKKANLIKKLNKKGIGEKYERNYYKCERYDV